jgi:hypothetical protein
LYVFFESSYREAALLIRQLFLLDWYEERLVLDTVDFDSNCIVARFCGLTKPQWITLVPLIDDLYENSPYMEEEAVTIRQKARHYMLLCLTGRFLTRAKQTY